MRATSKLTTLTEAVRLVQPGSSLSFSGFGHAGHPLAFVRELIRQGTDDLTLHAIAECWPAEFLVANGRVSRINLSNLMFEGLGRCRAISRAVEEGEVAVDDHSHLALSLRLLAGAWNVPFLPVRSMAGSDLVAVQTGVAPKYAQVRSPFTDNEVGAVAALRPDVAVIHVNQADEQGNGIVSGAISVIDAQVRAARKVVVTAERIVSADEITAANQVVTVPGIFVDAVVHTPYGAHPGGMYDEYDEDSAAMSTYYEASRSRQALVDYFAEHLFGHADHASYLNALGSRRLFSLRVDPALKIARGTK
ncbi:CoA-transferase [Micromonospora sp. FIMYZ51]|uniref:CoA transferase subunit A n=1 Tax=Micromonospora sp. FIMYZ51 TaxID=3051832 RepID=UPI00311E902D